MSSLPPGSKYAPSPFKKNQNRNVPLYQSFESLGDCNSVLGLSYMSPQTVGGWGA